jgi:hypothetical protein
MPYRLWYGEVEIDMIMEDELRRSGTARIGGSAVEVDAFIEIYLGSTPEYVGLPPGFRAPRTSPARVGPDADLGLAFTRGRPGSAT